MVRTATAPRAVSVRAVKLLRRAIMALSMAGVIAGALRVRGKGGVPPRNGGWRELPVDRMS